MKQHLTSNPVVDLPIGEVTPSPLNPRKTFAGIEDLAADIALFGVQQPITVRPHPEQDAYEIIMGERRWRACKHLGLLVIPAIVIEASDCDLVERALSENLSRQDLSCIEIANGFQKLLSLNPSLTHEALATRHRLPGGSTRVSNLMRLLKLPWEVRDLLTERLITEGHGTALCALEGQPNYQKVLADQVIDESLSVADLREEVRIKVAFLKEREQTAALPLEMPPSAPVSSSSTSATEAKAEGSNVKLPVSDVKSGFTPADATREFKASKQPDPDVPALSSLPTPQTTDQRRAHAQERRTSPVWLEDRALDLLPRVRLLPDYKDISIDEVAARLIVERAEQLGITPFPAPVATTRALMGDAQREKELADQTAAQARKQARAEAHEARVAESKRRAEDRNADAPTIRVYPDLATMQPETQEAIGDMVTAVIDAANRGELCTVIEDEDEPIFMTRGAEAGGSHYSFLSFWRALKEAKGKRLHSLKFADQAEVEGSANYLLTGVESRKPTLTTERYRKAIDALEIYTEAFTNGETYNWAGVTDTKPMMRRYKTANQLEIVGSQDNG